MFYGRAEGVLTMELITIAGMSFMAGAVLGGGFVFYIEQKKAREAQHYLRCVSRQASLNRRQA